MIEIKIYGHEYSCADGRKFVKYTTKDKNNVYLDVIFTKKCLVKPSEAKNYIVTFDDSNAWIKKTDIYNDILYINKVESIEELQFTAINTIGGRL